MLLETLLKTYSILLTYFEPDIVHNTILRLLERNCDKDNRTLAFRIARREQYKEVRHHMRFPNYGSLEPPSDLDMEGRFIPLYGLSIDTKSIDTPENLAYLKEILETKEGRHLVRHIAGHYPGPSGTEYARQLRPKLKTRLAKIRLQPGKRRSGDHT